MASKENIPTGGMKAFRAFAHLSLLMVFLLILIGATVRVTGAGMGCPDWPTCFGRVVPPTHESQLPGNYMQIYASEYEGFQPFNAAKTWTEYFNRLFGVLTGFTVTGLAITSFLYYRKENVSFVWLSFGILFLTMFEGWIGATVVFSNLDNLKITLHLLIAYAILGMLTYLLVRLRRPKSDKVPQSARVFATLGVLLFAVLAQVVMGAFTRTEIDLVSENIDVRSEWMAHAGTGFIMHRSFSWIVLLLSIWVVYRLRDWWGADAGAKAALVLYGVGLLGQMATGITLAYFAYPALGQFLHMLFASCMLLALLLLMSMAAPLKAAHKERGLHMVSFS